MKNKIQYFFKNIDSAIYNNPSKLAEEYLYFLVTDYKKNLINNSNSIFITLDNNELSKITKRCFLISDGLSISCNCNKSVRIGIDYTSSSNRAVSYYAFNNNLYKLGLWIQKSKSLLIEKKLSYYPNTYKYEFPIDDIGDFFKKDNISTLTDFTSISDIIIKNRKITSMSNNIRNKYFKPVLRLNIPVLDTLDLEDFCNITLDSEETLNKFQTYLRHSLLSINANSQQELEKLSLDLQLQLNDITYRYNKIISKYHITNAIGCIGFFTAMLFIIAPDVAEVLKVAIGTGSLYGLIPFLKNVSNYSLEKQELSNSSCYFLWILQQ